MERKIYDAAVEGSVSSLHKLLQEDALLLDRFITGYHPETPLHVASMLGHLEFVDEVLNRKPELAKELDFRKSSSLHLATAKGYLEIVKRLLQVNPDMCLVCDLDGRNPLHIAAIKGHINVLKELVQVNPRAAWLLMDEGETILHACVRHNQFEALRFLVENFEDHEFVNCQNEDGNTILHLAIAAKQMEAINLLISSTTVDVNCQNEDGFAVLDLLPQNPRDVRDKEIVESLRRMEAKHAKDKHLTNRELKVVRTKILTTSNQSNIKLKHNKCKDRKKFVNRKATWVEKKRDTLMLVASLLATMAFQAGVNPPSGVWQDTTPSDSPASANPPNSVWQGPSTFQDGTSPLSGFGIGISRFGVSLSTTSNDHQAGHSILADNNPSLYTAFLISNTIGFLASLSIILLLISGLPLRHKFFMWVLMVIMWVAITAMTLAYLASVAAFTPEHQDSLVFKALKITAVLVWVGLMLLLLLGHTLRVIIRLIKYLLRLVIRRST